MNKPGMTEDRIFIAKNDETSLLLMQKLVAVKERARDIFEKRFDVVFEGRIEETEDAFFVAFSTPEDNVQRVKDGFEMVVELTENSRQKKVFTAVTINLAADKTSNTPIRTKSSTTTVDTRPSSSPSSSLIEERYSMDKTYGAIAITEDNPNIGYLATVLLKNKGDIRDYFEKAFHAKFDSRWDEEDGVKRLMFVAKPENIQNVENGFKAILQIMADNNDTYVTSHMVKQAAQQVYGGSDAHNDNYKLSSREKVEVATASFRKNAPQQKNNDMARKYEEPRMKNNAQPKNNFNASSKGKPGGFNDKKFGFAPPNPKEAMSELREVYNYRFDPKSQTQVELYQSISKNFITFAIGPAGTGKTHIAIAKAVEALVKGDVEKIILSRPIIQNGKDMGALPGGIREKLGPFMVPLYDELNEVIKSAGLVDKLIESGVIEIGPIETARGRTFKKAFVVLDEAQNATLEQTKMILTRFGNDAKMALAGDPDQCDLPAGQVSGLYPYSEALKKTDGIGYSLFKKEDIFRHPIVSTILQVTENHPKILEAVKKEQKNTAPKPGNN